MLDKVCSRFKSEGRISFRVSSGAMDDGGGAIISWTALSVLRSLNARAKRTIRCVLWSCEEFGGIGAQQYFTAHQNEVNNMSLVMESDMGVFHPEGLEFSGRPSAQQVSLVIGLRLSSIVFLVPSDHSKYCSSTRQYQCNSSSDGWRWRRH